MGLNVRNFYKATNPSKTLAVEKEEDRKYYIDFSAVRGGQIIEELRDNSQLSIISIASILLPNPGDDLSRSICLWIEESN